MIQSTDVYLAGGMRSGWQDKVKEACADLLKLKLVTWNDPRENNTRDPELYGPMDRVRCNHADICFGYTEKDNPLPFPLFLEMGYFLGQKKNIIFVNEIEVTDPRYRPMLFTKVFGGGEVLTENNLEQGIKILRITILTHASMAR